MFIERATVIIIGADESEPAATAAPAAAAAVVLKTACNAFADFPAIGAPSA